MKKVLFIILVTFPYWIYAQTCDCKKSFHWVKETFENNDAGFSYVIEQKGEQAYHLHNQIFEQKAQKINNTTACAQLLYDWLMFFRSGHIGIRVIPKQSSDNESLSQNNQEIINRFKDWEKLEVDITKFKTYLDAKDTHDFEGVWLSEPYEIGIKKIDKQYIGFIIKADGVYWSIGQVKLKINEDNTLVFYMKDHSSTHFSKAELLGANILNIGHMYFERKYPEIEEKNSSIVNYMQAMTAMNPYFENINSHTAYLRIPDFGWQQKQKIDSVISINQTHILQTTNLIIDLRNNGGGSDVSFQSLLPILYTNPIRTIGEEFLSTTLNNQRCLDMLDGKYGTLDTAQKEVVQGWYDAFSKHLGDFVLLYDTPVIQTVFDTVYPYPKNIAIIINENNGSTAEQFLLAAKQSKKVKLFGTTTAGLLDFANMYAVTSPCNTFELAYCLSRSKRIPDMAIENKGIQPDYYIDNTIPKYEWIEYATKILGN